MSDAGNHFDRPVEATYEPPAWVKEWTGEPEVLLEHAEEIDSPVADWLFSSKAEAFEAGLFVGFNTAA
jgi:hypothetical protein